MSGDSARAYTYVTDRQADVWQGSLRGDGGGEEVEELAGGGEEEEEEVGVAEDGELPGLLEQAVPALVEGGLPLRGVLYPLYLAAPPPHSGRSNPPSPPRDSGRLPELATAARSRRCPLPRRCENKERFAAVVYVWERFCPGGCTVIFTVLKRQMEEEERRGCGK